MGHARRYSRRQLLCASAAVAGGWCLGSASWALGPGSLFRFGQLRIGSNTTVSRPSALRRLAWELAKRTSVDVALEPKLLRPDDEALHETPFLYFGGDREFVLPNAREIEDLRRFVTFGGFVLIDSYEGHPRGAFDRAVRNLVETLFPPPHAGLQKVAADHVVYRSFYLLDKPVGRIASTPYLEGVFVGDRMAICYCQNDLAGAWAKDQLGNYEYLCSPGGERQRERAYRLGVNLVMYALCLDYKSDAAHIEVILKRRRWRVRK